MKLAQDPSLAHFDPQVAPFFTGYRIDLEPRTDVVARSARATKLWRESFKDVKWEPPPEIDPREWFDIHNQGNVGSCQGQSLADGAEFASVIASGTEIQLSRAFAYLSTQEYDGLLGRDSGSTLSGGTKAARRGLPLESVFEYTANYRSILSTYKQKKSELLSGPLYSLQGEVNIPDADSCYRFLAGWSGPVQIGIDWTVKLTDGWEIKSYSSTRSPGGHAILMCGYLKVLSWPEGYGLLLKNSHSTAWGRNGWAIVKPSAFTQMMKSRNGIGIGRSDAKVPTPRMERIDHYRAIVAR